MKLYHGTNQSFDSIDLMKSKPNKDFGRGFYLSADYAQALNMAQIKTEQLQEGEPIVIHPHLARHDAETLPRQSGQLAICGKRPIPLGDGTFTHQRPRATLPPLAEPHFRHGQSRSYLQGYRAELLL